MRSTLTLAGAALVLVDRDGVGLRTTVDAITSKGGRAITIVGDVSNEDVAKSAVERGGVRHLRKHQGYDAQRDSAGQDRHTAAPDGCRRTMPAGKNPHMIHFLATGHRKHGMGGVDRAIGTIAPMGRISGRNGRPYMMTLPGIRRDIVGGVDVFDH